MTDIRATQVSAEQWGSGTPDMWATQLAVEMWAPVAAVTPPVVQTQARAMILV